MTRSHIGQSCQCVSVNANLGKMILQFLVLQKSLERGVFDGTRRVAMRVQHCHNLNITPQQHIGSEQKHGGCILCRLSAVLDSSQSHLAVQECHKFKAAVVTQTDYMG